jgi:hypothetical protein
LRGRFGRTFWEDVLGGRFGRAFWEGVLRGSGDCYEHARDQGTLGSVTGRRHSRTPGKTRGSLIDRGWLYGGSGSPTGRPGQ